MLRLGLKLGLFSLFAITSAARAGLDADVRAVLTQKGLAHASAGVAIAKVTASGPEFVFRSNATTPLMPASNLKVVTSSAALAILGPDFKFHTTLLTKDGDLYLLGDGDPTLGDPKIAEQANWSIDFVFKQWAGQLKKRGITSVRNVYIDDSIFDANFVNPNWPENQLDHSYVAQVGGLSFHFNTLEVAIRGSNSGASILTTPATSYVSLSNEATTGAKSTVGASRKQGTNDIRVFGTVRPPGGETFEVTVHDPGLYAGTVLAETLRSEGVAVSGGVARTGMARTTFASTPSSFLVVGSLETPIAAVLARCNKDSANLYAESLAKRLAAKATGRPGSWEGHRQATGAWLQKIGIPANQFSLDDGCGLSRENKVSPEAMVRVLAADYAAPYRQTFLDSLAIGGEDGTLSKRFKGMEGRVLAKSGFIDGVTNLSGFLKTKSGEFYAYSILLNHMSGGKPIHEAIVRAIDANTR